MPTTLQPPLLLRLATERVEPGPFFLAVALTATACAAAAAHAAVGVSAPLWLDESWTGALASLPSPVDLASEMRNEANAPAYYVLIWAFARLFGTSDVALHIPGLLLGCAAPAVAWLGLRRSRPRLAPVWAAAVGFWGPGIVQSGYARCYPLLLVAAVLSCIAFVRLLDAPTERRRAVAWAASGALLVLTHYHGSLLVGLQGAAWIALHRRRALAHWPAALVFLPALCWMAWHAPRLLEFARPDVAWTHPLTPAELPGAVSTLLGIPRPVLPSAAALLAVLELLARRTRGTGRDRPVLVAGGVALAAAVLFVALGCVRPLYVGRYLTPFAPGVALLISSRLVAASRGRSGILAASTAAYAALMATFWLLPGLFGQRIFTYEAASAWLSETRPHRLVFFWDNPVTQAETPGQLDLVGGYFLRRGGLPVDVVPVVLRPGADMNDALLAEADGRTAFLWLSDTDVHDTSVRLYPPRLAEARPDLECRDFGAGPIGIYACRPRAAPGARAPVG